MSAQNQTRTVGVALLIIAAGVLLLLEGLHILSWELSRIFITWQMLLIVIGIFNLLSSQHKVSGVILIAIGGIFLYDKFYDLDISVWNLLWPAILIIIGTSLLLKHSRKGDEGFHFKNTPINNPEDVIDEVSIFSGSEKTITSKNFRGGKITSIFGGSELNFTKAELSEGNNVIELFYMFGGSTIIVPANWHINIDVVAIFGGFSDKRYKSKDLVGESDKRLTIKGLVLFGGGEIKSY